MGNAWSWRNLGEHTERTADVNKNFEVTGMSEFSKKLDALLTTNPEMEKKIRRIIGRALKNLQKKMGQAASAEMESDPRHAVKAIRYTVYRRMLGGNVNIYHGKHRGAASSYTPERHPSHRGGNRKPRSERTQRLEGYEGADRSFILRFLETGVRKSGGNRQLRASMFKVDEHRKFVDRGKYGGNKNKYGKLDMVNTGNRGKISAKNWFGQAARMGLTANEIEKAVDKLIDEEFKKG